MLKSNKGLRFLLAGAAVLGIILLAVQSAAYALGADVRVGANGRQGFLTVDSGDKVKNLYAVGGQVIVNAAASKDAVLAGGSISVNGNVADDLIAAGGNISVNGNVGGSARLAGGTITVNSKITDDLVIAGGNLMLSQQASVSADILAAGGVLVVEGPVHGNITTASGSLYINGPVDGNVNFKGQRLELGPEANIKGNLDYTSKMVYVRDSNAKVAGQVNYHVMTGGNVAAFTVAALTALLAILLGQIAAALFLVFMYKKSYENLVDEITNSFWRKTMYGLVTIIVVPIVIVLLFITLIGYYVALLLLVVFILMLLLSWIIAVTQFGLWIMGMLSRDKDPAKKTAALGYVSVTLALIIGAIIKLIPVVGILFTIVMLMTGLGALISRFKKGQEVI
jgi:cytoskeletal protein CcmA (bactofilin family)